MQIKAKSMTLGLRELRRILLLYGKPYITDTWQAADPLDTFVEVLQVSGIIRMTTEDKLEELADEIKGNKPWLLKHFKERVSGQPLNPPPSHKMWAKGTDEYLSKADPERFSHSYPERMWPKTLIPDGIRYPNGDLADAARVLGEDPTTRQCFVPMFLPEDITASLRTERVPCSLGWHFINRDGKLHCTYPMRSTDAVRHLHHDLWFANALTCWMLKESGLGDKGIIPGDLHFSTANLHCFDADKKVLTKLCRLPVTFRILEE